MISSVIGLDDEVIDFLDLRNFLLETPDLGLEGLVFLLSTQDDVVEPFEIFVKLSFDPVHPPLLILPPLIILLVPLSLVLHLV